MMSDITAAMVKELRDATNVSMMECKKALVETSGNIDEAIKYFKLAYDTFPQYKAS